MQRGAGLKWYEGCMDVEIISAPAYALGKVTVPAGGGVRVQSGGMSIMQGDLTVDTTAHGGIIGGLKRSLGGASFFVNDFTSKTGGMVGVGPALPGDLTVINLNGTNSLLVQNHCWLASDLSIGVDSSWGGAKGFFSGAGLILLRCSGAGDLLVAGFGAIHTIDLAAGEVVTLDTGNVVAFDDTIVYNVRKAGGNWKTTLLGGEGLVTEFTGPGRLWWQTRSSSDLLNWIARHTQSTATT
jgi:uncharacterized protein (TIGR00266 family)